MTRTPAVVAGLLSSLCLTVTPTAAADTDLAALPVDPNVVTDSSAYIAAPPQFNPNGVPGVQQSFAHRDGSRQITDTLLTLDDPQAAVAALEAARSQASGTVVDQTTTAAPVGANGTVVTGTSPDGVHSVSVLLFTRGATAAEIRFEGGRDDPVPADLVVDYGQRQDDAIEQLTP